MRYDTGDSSEKKSSRGRTLRRLRIFGLSAFHREARPSEGSGSAWELTGDPKGAASWPEDDVSACVHFLALSQSKNGIRSGIKSGIRN